MMDLNNKIICIRNYKNIIKPEDGGGISWIKFYPDKLRGSLNFMRATEKEQSLYLQLFIRVREKDPYCGMFCYPNGVPVSFKDLLELMNLTQGSRTDCWYRALESLIAKNLLYLIDYNPATSEQLPDNIPATSPEVADKNGSKPATSLQHPCNFPNNIHDTSAEVSPRLQEMDDKNQGVKESDQTAELEQDKDKDCLQIKDTVTVTDTVKYNISQEEESKSFMLLKNCQLPEKLSRSFALQLPYNKIKEIITQRGCTQKVKNPGGYIRRAIESEIKKTSETVAKE